MAESEAAPLSLKERIAALQLSQVGKAPGQPTTSYGRNTNASNTQRPRSPPPPRPSVPARPLSSNNPPVHDHAAMSQQNIGNQPAQEPARPALPPRTSTQSSQATLAPNLPPRRPSSQQSPALPPRRPSEAPSQPEFDRSRRGSTDSTSSVATTRSSISGISTATSLTSQGERYKIRAPDYDPSALPALPPKRTKEEKEAADRRYAGVRPLRHAKSTPKVAQIQTGTTPPPSQARQVSTSVLPPPLPSAPRQAPSVVPPPLPSAPRQAPAVVPPPLPGRAQQQQLALEPAPARNTWVPPTPKDQHQAPEQPPRPVRAEVIPPPRPRQSALSFGMNKSTNTPPPLPSSRLGGEPNGVPPPIPSTSKPDLAALQASKPKPAGAATGPSPPAPQGACLICRDFSAPDNHAARFPRQSIPSNDLGWLAHQLTAPFTSDTDKARAIFTWEHHNIAYDAVAFLAKNVQPSTPQSTFETGLAVCEGYATLFCALALKAGLQAIVVSGHGKGYGYSAMGPGSPVPPYEAGHAWNAVKIDNGEWKLIDCCWGAGHLANQRYEKKFNPERFTQSNEEFGLDHFPGDNANQFRRDGRRLTWEEYILGDKSAGSGSACPMAVAEEGLSKTSFRPGGSEIVLAQQGPTVRFSFQKICPHWDPRKNGNGDWYLYVLCIDALKKEPKRGYVPFETNGEVWWCDVPTRDLGTPGEVVHIYTMKQFDGKDGRGLKSDTFRDRIGRCGWAGGGVSAWTLA
jgi:transglutaminase-like putative cysteine protease